MLGVKNYVYNFPVSELLSYDENLPSVSIPIMNLIGKRLNMV